MRALPPPLTFLSPISSKLVQKILCRLSEGGKRTEQKCPGYILSLQPALQVNIAKILTNCKLILIQCAVFSISKNIIGWFSLRFGGGA